jgi:hypothetical protein
LFETVVGPFPPKTNVMLRLTARDTAGNVAWRIPQDAVVYMAPAGAEQLIQLAYIFPRTKPNPLFEIEALRGLSLAVKAAERGGRDVRSFSRADLARLGVPSDRLQELGVDAARFEDLKADVHQLGLLNLDFDQIRPTTVRRVTAPGETVLPVNTIEVTIQ